MPQILFSSDLGALGVSVVAFAFAPMHLHKIIIKLFAETDTFARTEFVPIFHRWIQTQALPKHLLIDVADYAHVPDGPGTLLVADEANIHMDRSHGRLGLMYVRKRPIAGAADFSAELHGVLRETQAVARLLEQDPSLVGRLVFSKSEIVVRLNDRLLAPDTTESVKTYEPALASAVAELFPDRQFRVSTNTQSPLQLLEFHLSCGG